MDIVDKLGANSKDTSSFKLIFNKFKANAVFNCFGKSIPQVKSSNDNSAPKPDDPDDPSISLFGDDAGGDY